MYVLYNKTAYKLKRISQTCKANRLTRYMRLQMYNQITKQVIPRILRNMQNVKQIYFDPFISFLCGCEFLFTQKGCIISRHLFGLCNIYSLKMRLYTFFCGFVFRRDFALI